VIQLPVNSKPLVTVVVIGLRDAPRLVSCLESIALHPTRASYEVRVVLSDPTPRLLSELQQSVSGAVVASFRANLGFACAVNFAAARGRGQYVVLLNDDCTVERGWLDALVDTVERRPQCGLVSGTFLHPDGKLQEAGSLIWCDGSTSAVGDGMDQGSFLSFERRIDYASAGLLLVRRELWDELGGMDEGFYPAYFEDTDFCLRAKKLGWHCWYQPYSRVVHHRSSSTHATFRGFLFAHGRERFVNRWAEELELCEPPGAFERGIWAAMGHPVRVLVIDDLVPEPSNGAGFGRMHDVLGRLAGETDLHVAFYPTAAPANLAQERSIPGVRLIPDLSSHLATDGVDYDVVIVSRPHNVLKVRAVVDEHLPNAKIIYDAEALFHRRLQMQAKLAASDSERDSFESQMVEMRDTEISALRWADRVVCISQAEADCVHDLVDDIHVEVVGPLRDQTRLTPSTFVDRSDIGLVAGWSAGSGSPNSDGLLWFAREVFPLVRAALPSCRLFVTGANPPDDVRWLAGTGIEFLGSVKDLFDFYDTIRVAISPTRFGAGVKLKTVEAIQYGVPVVSTREGAAGLPDEVIPGAWVTDRAEEFAAALVGLLIDQEAWRRLRRAIPDPEHLDDLATGVGRWPDIVRDASTGVSRHT
jgi:GT2 family glycosyltransferase/glycosyltransferase involved in cell wall biosynthesis